MEIIYFLLAVIVNIVYTYAYLKKYASKLLVNKGVKIYFVLFIISSSLPLYNTEALNDYYSLRALIVLLVNLLLISLIFKASFIAKIYLLLNYYIYVFIGFIFYSATLLNINHLPVNMENVNLSKYYELSYLFSYLTVFIIFQVLSYRYEKKKIPFILKNKLILSFMIMIQVISIVNASLHLIDLNQNIYNQTLNTIVILSTFALYIGYLVIYLLLINVSYLSTYKFTNQVLEGQLQLQIDHYRMYDEHMKSIYKFKHDYQKIMNALMIINNENENPVITNIIKSSELELEHIKSSYKRYSDNFLVDALFNHYVTKLNLIGVKLNENLAIPIRFKLKEYEMIKLFSNILENAIEALTELPEAERIFKVSTKLNDDYQSILFENTTRSVQRVFFTKKADKIKHGFGLKIIEEILESNHGYIKIDYEEINQKFYFKIKITLPINKT